MKIRVYGPGCYACNELDRRVINVLAKLGIAVDYHHRRGGSLHAGAGD